MSKEKSKSHPFAGHLRDTEDIIWMSAQEDTTLWTALQESLPILAIIPGVIVVMVIINYVMDFILTTKYKISDTFYLVMVFSIIFTFFVKLWLNFRDGQSQRVYGVTNERLLYRNEQTVMTWPLEELLSVSVIKDGQESLSFGPLYPIWLNVNNAAAVKQIIEEARAERQLSTHA
jgi:hypothetical protein